jgi:hypothetical protein
VPEPHRELCLQEPIGADQSRSRDHRRSIEEEEIDGSRFGPNDDPGHDWPVAERVSERRFRLRGLTAMCLSAINTTAQPTDARQRYARGLQFGMLAMASGQGNMAARSRLQQMQQTYRAAHPAGGAAPTGGSTAAPATTGG